VMYKQTDYYLPELNRGIAYNDPDVAIVWPAGVELRPSKRDAEAPRLRDVEHGLPFMYDPA
jgi:dTDP-4-dehydrorhamnose 3,5-epimerase